MYTKHKTIICFTWLVYTKRNYDEADRFMMKRSRLMTKKSRLMTKCMFANHSQRKLHFLVFKPNL